MDAKVRAAVLARARALQAREAAWEQESLDTGVEVAVLRERWHTTPEGEVEGRIYALVKNAPRATPEQVATIRAIFAARRAVS